MQTLTAASEEVADLTAFDRTARLSCREAGKTRIFTQVRGSSGESRPIWVKAMILRWFCAMKFCTASVATALMVVAAAAQTDMQTSQRVPLPGTESKPLKAMTSIGPVPSDQEVQVTLILKRPSSSSSPSREAVERGTVQRLSAAQFAKRFSASSDALVKVAAFAQTYQLTVVESDPIKRRVILSGTASAIEKAFGTQLHSFEMPQTRQSFRTTVAPPTVPADLAPDIEAVLGLDTRPVASPHYVVSHAAAQPIYFDPPQIASLYTFPHDADGAGQTIAILEFGGGFNQSDLDEYFASLGLRSPKVTVVSVGGAKNSPGVDANPDGEVALDIEVAGAVANGANIAVYFAPNEDQGFVNAVLDAIHPENGQEAPSVVSISWGGPEDHSWSKQDREALNNALYDAAALGITVTAASGDDGSRDSVDDGQLHVDFPASSPYVLATGGTRLAANANAITSESVWNNPDRDGKGATGGGVSTVFARPAWQVSANVPSHPGTGFSGRGVPDVAGDADPDTGYRIRLNGADEYIGGTSAVAPLWAGLIAVLNQKSGQQLGFVNEKLYSMGPQNFNSITSGSNNNANLGAYDAGPGWNACTGLGSPDASQILASLTTSRGGVDVPSQTLPVAFGDTMDKVRAVYGVLGEATEDCESTDPCLWLAASSEGLTFFFKPDKKRLNEIRADEPFAGSIEGVSIGDTLDDVVAKLGQPTADTSFGVTKRYYFNVSDGVLACDFDLSGKCSTIFYSERG